MFWEAILIGLLFGWLRKGHIKNLNKLDFHGWLFIVPALLLQGLVIIDFFF